MSEGVVNNEPAFALRASAGERDQLLACMYAFLDQIGIPYREVKIDTETFLPGLRIENGLLEIDREQLKHPGDLLHEAGHIALVEATQRPGLNQAQLAEMEKKSPLEIGVLLWSYLAAKALDIPGEVVFHPHGYRGGSDWLLEQFDSGQYIGLPLLQWMGIAEPGKGGGLPVVKKWLR